MTKLIMGIDVACRAAHQASLANQEGQFWSGRKFRTLTSDLETLWSSLPIDCELTVVTEPTRNAWAPSASRFRRRGAEERDHCLGNVNVDVRGGRVTGVDHAQPDESDGVHVDEHDGDRLT